MAAFLTLAELRAQWLRARDREGLEGATIRVRARSVGLHAPNAFLTVVATAQQWVFCYGNDTLYRPAGQSWTYRPDGDGYLTIDLSAFDPDGQPSFYGYVPHKGVPQEVQVEVFKWSEFHVVMPEGVMA